jgi:hypothetical protein
VADVLAGDGGPNKASHDLAHAAATHARADIEDHSLNVIVTDLEGMFLVLHGQLPGTVIQDKVSVLIAEPPVGGTLAEPDLHTRREGRLFLRPCETAKANENQDEKQSTHSCFHNASARIEVFVLPSPFVSR